MEKKLRILFLEDSPEDAEIEERELRSGGLEFEARRAVRREDFEKALGEFEPDVVILDYTLPNMDGLEALRLARERRPSAPAIFVSGSIGEEKAIECLKAGATDYVLKQRLSGLVFAVRRALKEREQQESVHALRLQLLQAQKMDAIGRLAGGIAHDFNNILVGILGFSDLGLREVVPGEPLHGFLSEIRRASQRAAALTDQLLSFSRKQVLENAVLDLSAVVGDACQMLECTVGRNYEVRFVADPDAGLVRANRGQIEQVLLNLVLNARDAMPDGGPVTIRLENVDAARAAAQGVASGPAVALTVADEGCGMEPEIQEHLFEPFFTTKERGKGTGLGLSTVYGIAKQGGGHVSVSTAAGRGTAVTVLLPRVFEETPSANPPELAPTSGRGGETVLVVDDEEMVRGLLAMILAGAGYKVLKAADGRDALAQSAAFPERLHAVVTDLVMPGMSGLELAGALRIQRPDARILLVSGFPDQVPQPDAGGEALPLLKKPFTVDDLLRRVRDLLDRPAARGGAEFPAAGSGTAP